MSDMYIALRRENLFVSQESLELSSLERDFVHVVILTLLLKSVFSARPFEEWI